MGAKEPQPRTPGQAPNSGPPPPPARAEFEPTRQVRYQDPPPKSIAPLAYPPCPSRPNRQVRYSDESPLNNPTGDVRAPCNCPECLEARGEEVPAEIRKRYDRAMNKRLETK